jgi:UDP-N-acetylglucosamine/UDP-N-acetylgalactosamine diphosphorylase
VTAEETPPELRERLIERGQGHLLDHLDGLEAAARGPLLTRLAAVDWQELASPPEPPPAGELAPVPVVTLAEQQAAEAELVAAGEAAYAAGRVAVLMVAGGQGTRLGFPGPKGCFPLAPHSHKTLYQLQAEKLADLARQVGRTIPLLVMTSGATDAETRAFFAAHDGFGAADIRFFRQSTVPSVDRDGRALLAAPGELLESPDGHGGVLEALAASGNLARLVADGVDRIVYLHVDNPLAVVDDPILVGLAETRGADVVTKAMAKTGPEEKVGSLVRSGGRDRVVEYTELTAEQMRLPALRWGSPGLHCWSTAFLARLVAAGYRLPLHRSAKPLRAWHEGAERQLDGWKHERFVFDLLPAAERSVVMEIDRDAEFAPVKNATGPDSVETAVALAHRQYVRWLEAAGVRVELPPDALVEISPLFAPTRRRFLERWDGRFAELRRGCYLAGDAEAAGSADY